MAPESPREGRNRLIEALPRRQRTSLLGCLQAVDLHTGDILCQPGRRFRHAYFPLGGYISMQRLVDGGRWLELEMVGDEGMLGATLALGMNTARLRGIVQGPGPALWTSAGQLRAQLRRSPALARCLNAFLHRTVDLLAQTAGCIHYHGVGQRLARRLLMTQDRVHSDGFHLTHQSLADNLGVQRSAVTIAAGNLRRSGVIGYSRGRLTVLDRTALERASCACYAPAGAH